MLVATFIVVASFTCYCCNSEFITLYENKEAGLDVFYYLEDVGGSLPNYIFITFMAANIFTIDLFKARKSKVKHMEIERLGYKKVFIQNIKSIIISSAIFRIVCFIAMILTISVICHGFHFDLPKETQFLYQDLYLYSNNPLISFLIYILLSTVGYSMFCLLIYIAGYFVKNEYLYRCLGVIFGIVGQVGLAMLTALFGTNGSVGFDYLVINTMFVGNLLCPNICTIGYKPPEISFYIPVILALIFFGWIIFKLLKYIYKKEYREGS